MLHYLESCYCVTIDRESRDRSDIDIDINNCNWLQGSFLERGRCRCVASSIVSTITDQIKCVRNGDIDASKNM